MAEILIKDEDLTSLKGKVVIVTGTYKHIQPVVQRGTAYPDPTRPLVLKSIHPSCWGLLGPPPAMRVKKGGGIWVGGTGSKGRNEKKNIPEQGSLVVCSISTLRR